MKNTGIVRRVDDLGRIVLPKELRRTMDIKEGDPMEIFVDGESIVLKKYVPAGPCDETHQVAFINGKFICKNCSKTFSEEAL
jgi:transcriptional pleiotropic regulator of transition state genes